MGTTKRRVLFIADSMAQYDDLFRLTGDKFPNVTFRYPTAITHDKASIKGLIEDCTEVIRENDIEAIVTLHPANVLVQAVLQKEFSHLRGPSFDGALRCIHKLYNKQYILKDFHLKFKEVEVEDKNIRDYLNAFDDTGEPGHLVDAIGNNESMVKKIWSDKLSMKEIESIRKSVSTNYERFKGLIEQHADKEKHKWAFDPQCVISAYWKNFKNTTYHLAECCVPEKDTMITWALTDVVYDSGERKTVKYVSLPSTLIQNTQINIWGSLGTVCSKLYECGFKQHFFHALVTCSEEGAVKIVDLNCGIIKENTLLYRHVLIQGDNLKGLIQVSIGDSVGKPKISSNRFAMRAELWTYLDSGTVDRCLDLKTAKTYTDEVVLHVNHSDQAIVPDMEEDGMKLADVCLTGTNREECLARMKAICNSILKPGSKMNWTVETQQQPQHVAEC